MEYDMVQIFVHNLYQICTPYVYNHLSILTHLMHKQFALFEL